MRRSRSYGDMSDGVAVKEGKEDRRVVTSLREMKLERSLDRFSACRPIGLAKNSRSMILVALYPVVKESFQVYADICEVLAVLLDKFFDMEYHDCIKAFDAYASAAKQIDESIAFYNWCKDTGVARSPEYPEVHRTTSKLFETLEEFVRDRAKRAKSPERQHVNTAQLTGGNASSVALPSLGKRATPVFALPAPDGTAQTVNQDPFATSLSILPPSYVQMAEMEKRQHVLVQEQQLW